ncbi:MAG: DUF4199 domain-containing protein [Cytophagales bacterium]|nr:DUF4199 domain-containing protein [Bernardetiaceae bacterium]MDW8204293.1 DUF4199 domain-containing protein [Cytophagales bacterium]
MKHKLLLTAIATGMAAATAMAVFLVVLYGFQLNPFGQYKLMFMPLYALVLMFGLWHFRKQHMGGWLHGWQAIFLGVLTAIVAAATYAAVVYGLLAYILPNMLMLHRAELNNWMVRHRVVMVEQMGSQAYANNLQAIERITAADIALDEWIKTAAIGLVIGMAVGLFFKKTPPSK